MRLRVWLCTIALAVTAFGVAAPARAGIDVEITNGDKVFGTLNLLLIVHADHEQNCSTSTVRMVGSSNANLFASISAGIGALWGPLHGGANEACVNMLDQIAIDGDDVNHIIWGAGTSYTGPGGSWYTRGTPVPEPAAVHQLFAGAMLLAALARQRFRHRLS